MGVDSKWEGREADLCILLMRKGRKSEGARVREKERERERKSSGKRHAAQQN